MYQLRKISVRLSLLLLMSLGGTACSASRSISQGEVQTGKASFYSDHLQGHRTASGARFSQYHYTAAHRTLPMGSKVRVTNIHNAKHVDVIINDRGPYVNGRVIDLSKAAFKKIGRLSQGVLPVSLKVLRRGRSSAHH